MAHSAQSKASAAAAAAVRAAAADDASPAPKQAARKQRASGRRAAPQPQPQQPQAAPAAAVGAVHALVRRRLVEPLPRAEVETSPELGAHYAKLVSILEGTVVRGENNSALLLGPRGCGKSATLEAALGCLTSRFSDALCVVRLCGSALSDDRHATQAIARQICARQALDFSKSASYGENLAFLPAALEDCAAAHRGVIFVLDELDVFCQRAKQTLLYNLLDVLQSSRAQACVVGVSVRVDVADMMEKRVRSRFSHRRMLFAAPPAARAAQVVAQALTLPDAEVEALARGGVDGAAEHARKHNTSVASAFELPVAADRVSRVATVDASPRALRRMALAALASVDRSGAALLTEGCVRAACALLSDSPRKVHMAGLSVLQLFLLVAFKRVEGRAGGVANFESAMAEYASLQLTHGAACAPYARAAALRAYEALHAAELLGWAPMHGGGRGAGRPLREYRAAQLLVAEEELREAMRVNKRAPALLRQWLEREAVAVAQGAGDEADRAGSSRA